MPFLISYHPGHAYKKKHIVWMFYVFRKFFQVRVFEYSAVMRYSKVPYRFSSKFRKMHVASERGHEGVQVDIIHGNVHNQCDHAYCVVGMLSRLGPTSWMIMGIAELSWKLHALWIFLRSKFRVRASAVCVCTITVIQLRLQRASNSRENVHAIVPQDHVCLKLSGILDFVVCFGSLDAWTRKL